MAQTGLYLQVSLKTKKDSTTLDLINAIKPWQVNIMSDSSNKIKWLIYSPSKILSDFNLVWAVVESTQAGRAFDAAGQSWAEPRTSQSLMGLRPPAPGQGWPVTGHRSSETRTPTHCAVSDMIYYPNGKYWLMQLLIPSVFAFERKNPTDFTQQTVRTWL